MADFYRVELDVLHRMAQSLTQAGEQMETALKQMGAARDGQIGTPELDRAVHDFQGTWAYGLGQLKEGLSNTSEGVKTAFDAYHQLEQDLGNSLNQVRTGVLDPLGRSL